MNMNWGLCEAKDIVGEMVTVVDVGVSMYTNKSGNDKNYVCDCL